MDNPDWLLDPGVTYLNHGAFGSCPRPVQAAAQEFRARFERAPMQFVLREVEALLDQSRAAAGELLGADAQDLAFVTNATTAVSTVLASLSLHAGDELLVTDHAYNACRNAVDFHARRTGARVVMAPVPFPVAGPDEIVAAVLGAVTPRTRLALLDHITSPTALVFPVGPLVAALEARGVDTLIDGAHAPGQIAVDVHALGPTYYAANLHKWCCVPKTAAVLYVRRDRQPHLHPLVVSHGANAPRTDRPRFLLEFDWTGTHDPAPALSLPAALAYLGRLLPGGLAALRERNHDLVLRARRLLADALEVDLPCPDSMLGSMATLPLPARAAPMGPAALYEALWRRHRIEAPVFDWPARGRPMFRVSAQIYNRLPDYERLAGALAAELG
ncbi:MAG TPA: aminotransferase class V-fold PLP-dependent enzyme [Polyangia bacterium]|nr:aminotransferase class V-fold PLP-dependent enzyme [Polyangia bacterium]